MPSGGCDVQLQCVDGACVTTPSDPCAGIACSNLGTCAVANDAALCACDESYHAVGLTCVTNGVTCTDVDGDDYGEGCALGSDCDDGDGDVHQWLDGYADLDGDGVGAGATASLCAGATLPAGYVSQAGDCDDGATAHYQLLSGYIDGDGDSYGTGTPTDLCAGAALPSGYATVGGDCDDNDAGIHACAQAYEGFGAGASGGEGGTIYTVTTLANSGAGSLRDAVGGSNRLIEFAVSGTINLGSTLYIAGPGVTLDGFSAPSPGVTITGASIEIGGNAYGGPTTQGSNIIVRGLRFRGVPDDAIRIAYNAHDVVIDHNSFTESQDGEVDATEGAYNITISYNIFGNNNGPGISLLSYDAGHVTYHHNIFYNAGDRNPIVTGTTTRNYSDGPAHSDPVADVRYNIMWLYTMGTYVISSGATISTANVVSNLYFNDDGHPSNHIVRAAFGSATRGDAYVAGNVTVHDARGCAYSYNAATPCYDVTSANAMNNQSAAFAAPAVTGPAVTEQQGRLDTWQAVLDGAGVISHFPDDANDAAIRAAITVPALSIFSEPWSD
ncbi:MAG: right-handed parallel beta-helix repeat-containing protein [Myxococcota bacterium]